MHAAAGFSTPEGVVHDTAADVYFISNINGSPAAKDGNGFISRMRPDGAVDSLRFIAGGRDRVTLHAPKGMAIRGDTLWVSDIDAMRAFDRRTGAPLRAVEFGSRAGFLNDVAIGPDGMVYVSETGVRFTGSGEMQFTGTAGVFRLGSGRAVELIARDTALAAPNGITAHAGKLLVGSFAGPQIFAWTPGQENLAPTGLATGGIDGLEVLDDGRVIASSWGDSSIVVIGDSATRLISGLPAPADFTVDRGRRRLVVPLFQDDRVEIWQLP
jgi:sugar lactone lactonase YvrE